MGWIFTGGTLMEVGVYRQVTVEEAHEAARLQATGVGPAVVVQVGATLFLTETSSISVWWCV